MKSQVLENLEPVLWYVAETVVGQRQVDQIGGRFERLPRRLAEPVQVGVVGYVEICQRFNGRNGIQVHQVAETYRQTGQIAKWQPRRVHRFEFGADDSNHFDVVCTETGAIESGHILALQHCAVLTERAQRVDLCARSFVELQRRAAGGPVLCR